MINFETIFQKARENAITVSVAGADKLLVESLLEAKEKGLIKDAILVTTQSLIDGVDVKDFKVEITSEEELAKKAVSLVREGKAKALMKGKVQTRDFMKAVLNKEVGLRSGKLLSHLFFFEFEGKLRIVTDGGINIAPSLEEKIHIVNNAVEYMNRLGNDCPLVAVLAAVEVVNPNMEATLEASILSKMAHRRQIKNCIIDGPFALDNAINLEAAKHKKIVSPVAGNADIFIVPDIEAGNIFGKSVIYFANLPAGGIVAGAKAPIIMLSRADTKREKLNSIALAAALG